MRRGFPELTRCDQCGVLDDVTYPIRATDGRYWLHHGCARAFVPIPCEPLADTRGRTIGGTIETSDGEIEDYIFRSHGGAGMRYVAPDPADPNPPPGWLRSRCDRYYRNHAERRFRQYER